MLLAALCVLLSLAAAPVTGESDATGGELRSVHVTGHIYMLNGAGGNVGVSIGEDGILLVDSKPTPLADRLRAALAGLGGGKLVYLLNTHFHSDHVGGNPVLGTEGTIIAHDRVRHRLLAGPEANRRFFPPLHERGLPTLTFAKSLYLHLNDETIRAVHFPHCHTDGDIAVFFTRSNVVHLGDLFFNGLFPFVDLDYGGDVESLTRAVGEIKVGLTADTKIIPGHGPLATLEDLELYHRMLVETTAAVRSAMEAGKSLDQIRREGLPAEWEGWDWPFVSTRRWIEIVYWSLGRGSRVR
jgi:glyoxylase-like metal-dependent hydrolase (beta-lactamase superfamily II)